MLVYSAVGAGGECLGVVQLWGVGGRECLPEHMGQHLRVRSTHVNTEAGGNVCMAGDLEVHGSP